MDSGGTFPNGQDTAAGHLAAIYALAQRRRYHEAFHIGPDAQLVTDHLGLILEANPATAELLRYPREFLTGKPLALFSTQESRQRFYSAIAGLAAGAASAALEVRLARRGGETRDVYMLGWATDGEGFGRFLHWLGRDLTELRRSEASRDELQRQLVTAQEEERRRVARDLHDTVGQTLTALSLGVRAVRDAGPLPEAALAHLNHVQQLADDLARQVHDLATRLRPTALDDLGLQAAAEQLVSDWSAHFAVRAELHVLGLTDRRLSPEIETILYRVVQEALTNVAKHAGARHVAVVVGESEGSALAIVEDDGQGFEIHEGGPPPSAGWPNGRGRLGLLGMRERVTLAGGSMEVESSPGGGTTILVRIPLPAAAGQ